MASLSMPQFALSIIHMHPHGQQALEMDDLQQAAAAAGRLRSETDELRAAEATAQLRCSRRRPCSRCSCFCGQRMRCCITVLGVRLLAQSHTVIMCSFRHVVLQLSDAGLRHLCVCLMLLPVTRVP